MIKKRMRFKFLSEARAYLRATKRAGLDVKCPCCGQTVKVYSRKITGTMIRHLSQMVHSDWPLRPNDIKGALGGDYSKLKYWGLVEQLEVTDDKAGTKSCWAATDAGRLFLCNDLRVPEIAYVFNRRVLRMSRKKVSVMDRLDKKFDYADLMSHTPNLNMEDELTSGADDDKP